MTRNPIPALIWVAFTLLAWPGPGRSQLVINEVLVKNKTTLRNSVGFETYLEIYNTHTTAVSLAGWSLSDTTNQPAKFVFPAGAVISARGYLLVWCDKAIGGPASEFHADFKLKDVTDDLGLFHAGILVDYVAFGLQVADLSISRIPNGVGPWQLGLPTPLSSNFPIVLGTPSVLRINEWMAANSGGDDWLEIYSPATNGPVSLGGLIIVDSTNAAEVASARPIPSLSVMEPGGFIRFWADALASKDADHLGFKLSKSGDSIALFNVGGTSLIDRVVFQGQTDDISMGRLPDGSPDIIYLPEGNGTPEHSNLLPLTNVVVNELLAHTDPPLEDAVEFYNATAVPVDLGNYWLSNDRDEPMKYRIPTGTIIPAFGFKVFYEYTSWNWNRTGISPEFTFNAAHGDQVVLCSGNGMGKLTGYGVIQEFGGSLNGVAFGRHMKSDGSADFVPMSDLSLGTAIRASSPDTPENRALFESGPGAPNPYPLVGPIVISEIMYHPPEEWIGSNWVDNTWAEFIELHNVSTNAVPLYDPDYPENTWRLRDAVDFDFPPGTVIPAAGYLAVISFDPVSNPDVFEAFCSRYHLGTNFAMVGPYQRKLANSGDNIELRKPDAPTGAEVPYVLVERVDYQDSAPWPELADGDGLSLHRLDPAGYANDPSNWIAAVPTPLMAKPSLLINEILPHAEPSWQAAVELANPTVSPVDISGWWLSNDQNAPQKYRIPANTFVPAFGFKTFYESEFNPDGSGLFPGFTLDSARGGEVVLASADASGNLTGEWLTEAFGPSEEGVSLGRYANSEGRAELVPMKEVSLGSSNSYPRVGRVVISEIMYHPLDLVTYSNGVLGVSDNTLDEYIELENLSSSTVPLFSTATNAPRQFTNTWRLRNEVQYDFPLFVSLPPRGRLLIVNFNPAANPAQHKKFRAAFNVPGNVQLLGAFTGSLNNRSGTIELYKPGLVQMPPRPDMGFVPYILAESVTYQDSAPWPTNSDGYGSSLQRAANTAYADDPANWFGATPTGGRPALPAAHFTGQPPGNTMAAAGGNVTLTALAEGASMIAYQWYFNGLALTNASRNWLSLTNVQSDDEGTYQLVASNVFGMDTSAVAHVTVAVGPSFLEHPSDEIVMLGESLRLTTTVTGTPPFGFTWLHHGPMASVILADHATHSPTDGLQVSCVLMSDAGGYQVYVTNLASVGGVDSSVASVAVVQPLGERMVLAGSNITLTANVASLGGVFYQWQFNDANLPGATSSNLALTNVRSEQGGVYRLLVSTSNSFAGLVKPVSCPLAVQTTATAPEVVQQPASLRIGRGARALVQVTARGTDPLSYQWWHDRTNLLEFGTNSFLEFAEVAENDFGTYMVAISNRVGVATSRVVRLVEKSDHSGAPLVRSISAAVTSTVSFSFETEAGFDYQVEYKHDLAATDWLPLEPPQAGNGMPVVIQDSMKGILQRFYRVRVLP
jgi:hypothetical protein